MKLFISYSHDDEKYVKELARLLEKYGKHSVWMDEDLKGGEHWWSRILDEIEGTTCVIAVLSPSSRDSKYCIAELSYAHELNKPILPLIHKRFDLHDLPDYLQQIHNVDIIDIPESKALEHCDDSLSNILSEIEKGKYQPPNPKPLRPPVPKDKPLHPPKAPEESLCIDPLLESYATVWDRKPVGSAISMVEMLLRGGWILSRERSTIDVRLDKDPPIFELLTSNPELLNEYCTRQEMAGRQNFPKYSITRVFLTGGNLNLRLKHIHYFDAEYSWEKLRSDGTRKLLIHKMLDNPKLSIDFANVLVFHIVVQTSDDYLLLVQRSKDGIYSHSWQLTISEHVSESKDFGSGNMVAHLNNCVISALVFGLKPLEEKHCERDSFRILSVFLESQLPNVGLCTYVKLKITRVELDGLFKHRTDNPIQVKYLTVEELPETIMDLEYVPPKEEAVSADKDKDDYYLQSRKKKDGKYHPDTGYLMRMAYNYRKQKDIDQP